MKTAPEILQLLHRETGAALGDAALRERLLGQGIELDPTSPAALRELFEGEIAKWARVIRDAGITPE